MLEAGDFVAEMGFGVAMTGIVPEGLPPFPVELEGVPYADGGASGGCGGEGPAAGEPLIVRFVACLARSWMVE